jgi:hypothetical protein
MTWPHQFVRWRQQVVGLTGNLMVMALPVFAQPKTGDIVFQTDFEGAGTLRAWGAEQNQNVRLAAGFQSAQSLQVERQTNTAGSASVVLPLPINKMRGARLACCAMVRADGVIVEPTPWGGPEALENLEPLPVPGVVYNSSYHAFREWSGWSVEHGQDKGDTAPSKTQTSCEKLLREWYGKNVKAK